jgi:Tfp pilus assembly protein PilN
MNNEEMKKKMEFIVEQQAQFAADIQVMREVQAQDAKQFNEQDRKLSDAMVGLLGFLGILTQAQTRSEERIDLLARKQITTDEEINRLEQAQARTEERLNALISVVERFFSGNGGTESLA